MTSALELLTVSCRRPRRRARWAANALRSRAPCSCAWCSPRTACSPSIVSTSSRRTPTNGTWPRRWWDCWWKRPSPSTANVDRSGNGQSNFKTGFNTGASVNTEVNTKLNLFSSDSLCCNGQAHPVTLVYFNGLPHTTETTYWRETFHRKRLHNFSDRSFLTTKKLVVNYF